MDTETAQKKEENNFTYEYRMIIYISKIDYSVC